MAEQKYSPIAPVNIGVGKDTINDFARKYNLEIEKVYEIFNQYSPRKVAFTTESTYWVEKGNGFVLSIPYTDNSIVFAVYRNEDKDIFSQVLTGIKQTKTTIEVESVEKFDGFLLYAAIDNGMGIGGNLPSDIYTTLASYNTQLQGLRNETKTYHDDAVNKYSGNYPYVTPEMFGAVGNANYYNSADGHWYSDSEFTTLATDDTQAWVSACAAGKNILAKYNAKYRIVYNAGSSMTYALQLKDGVTLDFNGATLCWESHSGTYATLLAAKEVKCVTIKNGAIRGTKDFYNGSSAAHAIKTLAGKHIVIENMDISYVSGDGVGVDQYPAGANYLGEPFEDVVVRNCKITNHDRNGISVYNGKNLLIDNCYIANAGGNGSTLHSGIDVEPNRNDQYIDNLVVRNCTFVSNTTGGMMFALLNNPLRVTAIVEGCTFDGGRRHLSVGGTAATGSIIFNNCISKNAIIYPVSIDRTTNNDNFKLYFNDIVIENPNTNSSTDKLSGTGIAMICNTESTDENNIFFDGVQFIDKKASTTFYSKNMNFNYRGNMPDYTNFGNPPKYINLDIIEDRLLSSTTLAAGSTTIPNSVGTFYPCYIKSSSATTNTNLTIDSTVPSGIKIKFYNNSPTKVINITQVDTDGVEHTATIDGNSVKYWDTTDFRLI